MELSPAYLFLSSPPTSEVSIRNAPGLTSTLYALRKLSKGLSSEREDEADLSLIFYGERRDRANRIEYKYLIEFTFHEASF